MRKFILGTLLGVVLSIAVGVTVFGTAQPITYRTYAEGTHGTKVIEVKTGLVDYVFSANDGTMKSAYLYFAPYGSRVEELVPGTTTVVKDGKYERKYTAGVVFPFTVVPSPKAIQSGGYTLAPPQVPSPHEFELKFIGSVAGFKITKQFIFHNDPYYDLNFTLQVENSSGKSASLFIILGYIPIESSKLVYEFDGSASAAPLAPGSYTSFDGVGLMDKKTVFFLKTTGVPGVAPFVAAPDKGHEVFGVKIAVPVGKSSFSFPIYTGRRRYLLMNAVGLGTLDNPGSGARLIIPVVQFLQWLYHYTGNYGWAIILFTLVTRLVLFPLMRKQYHSMAKMQKLQPKLQEIQKRFKDDRQLLQQKMMELYKKEGVNPMGGCLPMFIQLPILILLWKAILYASEEIHFSPGFLWIPDLSLRDPYFILVIVTTGLMIVQQRLMMPMSSGQTAGSQKYMGYIFPLFMAVFFWNFPAGLWLYYLLTTVSQVGQQAFVNWELAQGDTAPAAPELSEGENVDGSAGGNGQGSD